MKIIIAGAGIGGLTSALSLHAAGFLDVQIFEAAQDIREIGVGVNLPPHAVRELIELGLGDGLAEIGSPTRTLSYYDRAGKLIWAEKRGLDAGYHWPQYSVHRGRLQRLLLNAVQDRLGVNAVLTGHRVVDVKQHGNFAEVFVKGSSGLPQPHEADVIVGADGIRSALRTALYGDNAPMKSNGWVMYRGATQFPTFLDGRTMVIVGDEQQRIVVYPIDAHTLNWLLVRPLPDNDGALTELGNWNRSVNPLQIAERAKAWDFDWLNIPALINATDLVYEYPMADIDPLPQWSFGQTTLLGDAAHAMYPFGSNGASQAILDARVLSYELARHRDPASALSVYEATRREQVAKVQLANRRQAGDVMAKVGALSRAQDHAQAKEELKTVEQTYKTLAGFDVETLNNRSSFSVT